MTTPVLPETPVQLLGQDREPAQPISVVTKSTDHLPECKSQPEVESNNLVDGEIPASAAIGFFQDHSKISQKLHPRFLQAFHPPLLRPPRLSA